MQNLANIIKQYNLADYAKSLIEPLKNLEVDKSFFLKLTSASLVTFSFLYIGKIWYSYKFFQKRNIPTPEYKFFYGNVPDLFKKDLSELLQEWSSKYGKIYGYYEGHLPILVTSDIEIIEEICLKQFSNFTGRKLIPNQISDKSDVVSVFMASGNRWKRLRTITNPTFSPAKIKEMFPLMRICSDRLVKIIENDQDKELDITELLDRMSMDAVWTCLLGFDVDLQKNHDLIYFKRTRDFLESFFTFDFYLKLTTYMHEFKAIFYYITQFYTYLATLLNPSAGNAFFWMIGQIDNIVNERNKSNVKKSDYVQIILEAEASKINLDFDNQRYESSETKIVEKKMSHSEVIIALFSFMVAGYDTTSATLGYSMHVLASHPEELVKLQQEIDTLNEFTFEEINKLVYLDLFIKEVMRMFATANPSMNRRCTKATTIKGVEIPENLIIQIDVQSLHFNPEYWGDVDPYIFYPQRFADESKINKMAYMPFGAGPRICVGMKFALLEMKLTLARILKQYDVLPGQNFNSNFRIKGGLMLVRRPENPVYVIFKKRTYYF